MTSIKQALDALNQGDKAQARTVLANLVKAEPQNADAWLLLAKLLDDPKQVSYCRERAQAIIQSRSQQDTSEADKKALNNNRIGTAKLGHLVQDRKLSENIQPAPQTKTCPLCTSQMPINARVCPTCGKDILNEQHDNLYRVANSIGSISTLLLIVGILLPICVCLIGALFTK
jgi:predicted nucleic acid-binding Zn ribbon protein